METSSDFKELKKEINLFLNHALITTLCTYMYTKDQKWVVLNNGTLYPPEDTKEIICSKDQMATYLARWVFEYNTKLRFY